ncbi:carboxylating nicotinate-nucleotide diphosphorylase [Helicobacter sp. MIT 21-1697]|uniref:carboxylating nicotinate-nucleotide diphosphorylase n=1 Tax=Helicobacter sp. MIT 21-1697 TaxID=2993733 RepID=UPI00224AAA17|nr:carboxylating nicotinate-nucleotide diphosphorylase [Helicobacter sp. MIT 21-1697]MCX2716627.1 carboxylating nicotinate-nucleotide diphosphorylase [Helicobacter sp. MIT 21-1697]
MLQHHIKDFIKKALDEDLGRGDLYALFATDKEVQAYIIAKQEGVFSGEIYLRAMLEYFGLSLISSYSDGELFAKGAILCRIKGSHIHILQLERVLLNILAHSSGIATLTASYVRLIKDTRVKLLDTRKTRPLLRQLEKYSIINGGGHNHRFGLDSMLMLKDTHLAYARNLAEIISTARKRLPFMCPIEIECENFEQAKEAIHAKVDVIMCDNMSVEAIQEVVAYRNANAPHIYLEASGNITFENIRDYAFSGVDAISVGSLIHQAKWLDFSLKIEG